ncbi:MAG: hypothetical protein ACYTEG_15220, partial [Planctomycetota bacterium]
MVLIEPRRIEERIDPEVLEIDLPGNQLGEEDHETADDEGVGAVAAPRLSAARPMCAQAIQAQEPEVLGREVIGDEAVVDDDQGYKSLGAGPGQRLVAGQQQTEREDHD